MIPVDVHALGCDPYANSLHKWSLAPAGNGCSMCGKKFKDASAPCSALRGLMPSLRAHRNLSLALAAGCRICSEIHRKIGIPNIEARTRMLSDTLTQKLAGSRG